MEDQAFVIVQLVSSPTPSLPQNVDSLFLSSYVSPVEFTGGGGEEGAKS